MNTHRGFIQIPLLIAIVTGILILSSAGYLGWKQVRTHFENPIATTTQTSATTTIQVSEIEQLKQEVEDLKKQVKSNQASWQKVNNSNGVKKPSVEVQNNNVQPTVPLTTADIIAQWTPSIAHIVCDMEISDQKIISLLQSYGVDTTPVISSGSGLLLAINDPKYGSTIAVVTNRHVLNAHNGFSWPTSCAVSLPGGGKFTIPHNDINVLDGGIQDDVKIIGGEPYVIPPYDSGYLKITDSDSTIIQLAHSPKLCDVAPRIGDDVIILGYPSIGSLTGITATDGIISGTDGIYYVTSAKVEHGDSGGAAILKSQNCYLGIPSYAITGSVESLARILSLKGIFSSI